MFVDASAIVAILTREPEADALADGTHPLPAFALFMGLIGGVPPAIRAANPNVV